MFLSDIERLIFTISWICFKYILYSLSLYNLSMSSTRNSILCSRKVKFEGSIKTNSPYLLLLLL